MKVVWPHCSLLQPSLSIFSHFHLIIFLFTFTFYPFISIFVILSLYHYHPQWSLLDPLIPQATIYIYFLTLSLSPCHHFTFTFLLIWKLQFHFYFIDINFHFHFVIISSNEGCLAAPPPYNHLHLSSLSFILFPNRFMNQGKWFQHDENCMCRKFMFDWSFIYFLKQQTDKTSQTET